MKKTRILVMTLALTLGSAISAYAVLPYNQEGGLIVMGNRAYSVYYLSSLNSATDMRSINDRVSQNTNSMYYLYPDNTGKETIVNTANISGTSYSGEGILNNTNPITYTGVNGEQNYIYNTTTGTYDLQTLTGNAYITVQNMNTVNTLSVILYKSDLKGLTGATPVYYKLDDSSTIAPLDSTLSCLTSNKTTEKVYILSADKTTIATGILDTTNTYGNSYSRPFTLTPVTDSSVLNTVGNINNNGYATYDGLWIYYSNTADGGKLYKVKADGMDNQPISNDKVAYLNIVGTEVYYSNLSDSGKIYRVNTDGTGRIKVCDDMASYLVVSGNYIYYSNHSKNGSLSKVDIQQQGGSGQVLTTDDAAYIDVEGNVIYYSNNSDGKKIYSANTDGLCRVALSTDGGKYVNASGGYIYYGNYADGGRVYKMKADGSSNVKLSSHRAGAINIAGNTIYYSNYDDGNKLYKINTDGGSETGPIIKNSVEFINIIGNSIYFTSSAKLSIASPLDGSSKINVAQVTKPALPDKVSQVNNITLNVDSDTIAANYPLPDKVPAIMNNNVMKEIVINWNTTPTKKGSTYVYTGTLLGYGNKVTMTITVTASTPVNSSNVTVVNNAGDSDAVTVTGLTAGSVVKIYNDNSTATPLATATVPTGSTSVTANLKLNPLGGSVWITLTLPKTSTSKVTPTESPRIEVVYSAETQASILVAAVNNPGSTDTVTVTGDLVSGDIVKIYKNQSDTTPIATGKVIATGTIAFDNLDFGANAGTVWASVTSTGKSESAKVSGSYGKSSNLTDVEAAQAVLASTDNTVANSFAKALAAASNTVSAVKNDITLPTTIGNVTVSWKSSKSAITVVGSKAIVHRSTTADVDNIVLTATLTEGDASATVDMSSLTVPKVSDQEAADSDKTLMKIGYSTGDSQTSVTNDLTLPLTGQNGSTATWVSSDPSVVSIDTVGSNQTGKATVKQPPHGSSSKNVVLTATLKKGSATATFTITVTVLPENSSQEDVNFALQQIPDSISVNDTDHAETAANVGSLSSSISYGFTSDNSTLLPVTTDTNSGKQNVIVHSQSYSAGKQTVNLTIKLTSGTQTASKKIAVTVNSKVATDDEFVTAVGNSMSAYMVLLGNTSTVPPQVYLPTSSYETNTTISGVDVSAVALMVSPTELNAKATNNANAASITWTSDDGAITVLGNGLGSVNIGAKKKVTLTATITRGTGTYKKVIIVNVP